MNENVTEITQLKKQCNEIVTALIDVRKEAGLTQKFISEWIGCSRKKLIEFESGKFDFDLMVKYADKLSFDIKISYTIN